MGYLYLAIAIASEVIGTLALKSSSAFSNYLYTTVCIVCYVIAFYFLSLVLKTIPVGIAYAIWAGMGIVLVAVISAFLYQEVPDLPAIVGMFLIIFGVFIMMVFSKNVSH